MADTVLYQREGKIVAITYNRPEVLNAINRELRADLNASWVRFRDDEEAHVAIVTEAGRAFQCRRRHTRFWLAAVRDVLGGPQHDLVGERPRSLEADHRGGERVLSGPSLEESGEEE